MMKSADTFRCCLSKSCMNKMLTFRVFLIWESELMIFFHAQPKVVLWLSYSFMTMSYSYSFWSRQIISFSTYDQLTAEGILLSMRASEPCQQGRLAVWEVVRAPKRFHALFSASWRRYLYLLPTQSGLEHYPNLTQWHFVQHIDFPYFLVCDCRWFWAWSWYWRFLRRPMPEETRRGRPALQRVRFQGGQRHWWQCKWRVHII